MIFKAINVHGIEGEKKKERIYLTNEMTFLTFDILR